MSFWNNSVFLVLFMFSVFAASQDSQSSTTIKFPQLSSLLPDLEELELCRYPELNCIGKEVGAEVINPLDCYSYYLCINVSQTFPAVSDSPVPCDDGQYFNPDESNCVNETEPCTKPCVNYKCDYTCDYGGPTADFVPDINDCSVYYLCMENSYLIKETCPDNSSYFDGDKDECTSNPYVCCDACIPYCEEAGTETMDPRDCQSFYLCTEIGVPSVNNHYSCESGYQFDPDLNRCVSGDDCTSRCSASTTTTTTTEAPTKTSTITPPSTVSGVSTTTTKNTQATPPKTTLSDKTTADSHTTWETTTTSTSTTTTEQTTTTTTPKITTPVVSTTTPIPPWRI